MKRYIVLLASLCALCLTVVSPAPVVHAAETAQNCGDTRLLTFPAWYRNLPVDEECNILKPETARNGVRTYILTIAINLIEILLQVVAYAAAGYIIYGGYRYITSAGSPDGMVVARKSIINATIGFVLSILSIALVNLIMGAIK